MFLDTDATYLAGRRLQVKGQVFKRGDVIPVELIKTILRLDVLLEMQHIVKQAPSAATGGGVGIPVVVDQFDVDSMVVSAPQLPDGLSKINDILDWVGEDAARARVALDSELSHKNPRKRLVVSLEPLVA